MTEPIRAQVVEAMAQAVDRADSESIQAGGSGLTTEQLARVALDAALDVLGEHIDASWPTAPASWLLAQLRPRAGKGSDE